MGRSRCRFDRVDAGSVFAAKVDNHRIDLLGVGVVGTATGLGGAVMRDILLYVTPAALSNNWYLPVAVVASMVGMVLVRLIARLEPIWVVLHALPVGLYTTIGMTRALSIGLPLLPAMFVGVTAGVGGSALRDMLLAQPVAMLKVGTLYAVAAIAVLWLPPPCECARCGSAGHCPSNARGC